MALLVILVLLALVFGIGALIQGVIWLASVGFILALVLVALAISRFRSPGSAH